MCRVKGGNSSIPANYIRMLLKPVMVDIENILITASIDTACRIGKGIQFKGKHVERRACKTECRVFGELHQLERTSNQNVSSKRGTLGPHFLREADQQMVCQAGHQIDYRALGSWSCCTEPPNCILLSGQEVMLVQNKWCSSFSSKSTSHSFRPKLSLWSCSSWKFKCEVLGFYSILEWKKTVSIPLASRFSLYSF